MTKKNEQKPAEQPKLLVFRFESAVELDSLPLSQAGTDLAHLALDVIALNREANQMTRTDKPYCRVASLTSLQGGLRLKKLSQVPAEPIEAPIPFNRLCRE